MARRPKSATEVGGSGKIRFTENFDYRWPSRSVTAYRAGWEGRVKAEVRKAAVDSGKAVAVLDEVPDGEQSSE